MTQRRRRSTRLRTLARERALQALYQWQLSGQSAGDIERQFVGTDDGVEPGETGEGDRELEDALDMAEVDVPLFRELLHGVLNGLERWDAQIRPHLDRALQSLDPTERVILRLGTFELNERLDVPFRVVINEYVELAKRYGGEDSHKYINGVLDKVGRSHRLRATEMDDRRRPGAPR